MKGTLIEFIELAADNRQLAEELVVLAARYGFEFTADDELSDKDLETVAGGRGGSSDLDLLSLQARIQSHNRRIVLVSRVMKERHDTAGSAVSNMRS